LNQPSSTCWDSDSLTTRQGRAELRPFSVEYYFKPFQEGAESGDRFTLRLHEEGSLYFYVADAAGHGRAGARIWEVGRAAFDKEWDRLAAGPYSDDRLLDFASRINDLLASAGDERALHVCLVVGSLSSTGNLSFATFGYGAHALVSTFQGAWRAPSEKAIGMKLGWMPSESWRRIPNACVVHRVDHVRRLTLFTDAFLGDNYADVSGTLGVLRDLGELCQRSSPTEIVSHFQAMPHDQDDATLLVVKVEESRLPAIGDRHGS